MKKHFNKESQYIPYEEGSRLYEAAISGDNKTLAALLKKYPGSNIDQPIGPFYVQPTLLQAAASGGHKETVELLLKLGANVNQPGLLYGGALTRAVASGHIEIAKLLLDKGANVDGAVVTATSIYDTPSRTPLIAAINTLRPEMVNLLVERGADVSRKTHDGETIFQRLNKSLAHKLGDGFEIDERQWTNDNQLLQIGAEIQNILEKKIAQQNNAPVQKNKQATQGAHQQSFFTVNQTWNSNINSSAQQKRAM